MTGQKRALLYSQVKTRRKPASAYCFITLSVKGRRRRQSKGAHLGKNRRFISFFYQTCHFQALQKMTIILSSPLVLSIDNANQSAIGAKGAARSFLRRLARVPYSASAPQSRVLKYPLMSGHAYSPIYHYRPTWNVCRGAPSVLVEKEDERQTPSLDSPE